MQVTSLMKRLHPSTLHDKIFVQITSNTPRYLTNVNFGHSTSVLLLTVYGL